LEAFHPSMELSDLQVSSFHPRFASHVMHDVTLQLGIAFAMGRLFRRFRLPIELAVAAPLAASFPSLTRINVASLAFNALPTAFAEKVSASKVGQWKPGQRLAGVVDQYGAAYFLAARVVGLALVFSLYAGDHPW
jgi:hypothetical protein